MNENARPLMGDDDWVVQSSHTENPRSLTITFEVPKDQYKGSNTRGNDIILRRKTTWLREHAEQAWATAIQREFGVTALEPPSTDYVQSGTTPTLTPTEQTAYDTLSEQQVIVDRLKIKITELDTTLQNARTTRKTTPRKSDEYTRLTGTIDTLTKKRKDVQAQLKLETKLLTKARNAWVKAHEKQDRRRSASIRKKYLKDKAQLNESRLVFPNPVEVLVQSNVVTSHAFDAPNCWPTVKPLQDGGTDTCVLWHDDNNQWIHKTTFYGGSKDSDCYVIRIMVRELTGDDGNPFSQEQ